MSSVASDAARQRLAGERSAEQLDHVAALGAAADHRIDAKLGFAAGLLDLPGAGAAEDHRERVALPACPDRVEHPPRVQRVDWFSR
jgi:hypothetical protein